MSIKAYASALFASAKKKKKSYIQGGETDPDLQVCKLIYLARNNMKPWLILGFSFLLQRKYRKQN